MLSLPSDLQTQLDTGRVARAELLLFDFPSPTGLKGFWTGSGTLVWSGITFISAGSMFEISTIGGSMTGEAVGLAIRVNGDARMGLDASTLASIETIQYRGRPVTIYRRYMNPETYAEIATLRVYRGYIDKIDHNVTEGGEAYLEAAVESRSLDLGRSGYRMRTDADQRAVDATDDFFKDVATVQKREVQWADLKPEVPVKRKKILGLF